MTFIEFVNHFATRERVSDYNVIFYHILQLQYEFENSEFGNLISSLI
jgi:hypothetical protein